MEKKYLDIELQVAVLVRSLTLKETVHLASEILFDAAYRTSDKRTKKYLEVLGQDVAKMTGEVRE